MLSALFSTMFIIHLGSLLLGTTAARRHRVNADLLGAGSPVTGAALDMDGDVFYDTSQAEPTGYGFDSANYESMAEGRCLSPQGFESRSGLPVGDATPKTLQKAINSSGPWETEWLTDKYGPFDLLSWNQDCRSQPATVPIVEVASQCGRICDAMGSECELFTLYGKVKMKKDASSSELASWTRRCCFGRLYIGTAEDNVLQEDGIALTSTDAEKVTCYRKKSDTKAYFTKRSGRVLGVPLRFDYMGEVKEGRERPLKGWQVQADYPYCGRIEITDLPQSGSQDRVAASMACREGCSSLRTSYTTGWEKPAWCEAFSVYEGYYVVDVLGGAVDEFFECCFYSKVDSGVGVSLWNYGGDDQSLMWQFVATEHKSCHACEYDCSLAAHGSTECVCPGQMQDGSFRMSVLVGDVCSWCEDGSTLQGLENAGPLGVCSPVDVCIDNKPGCEGICVFNWATLKPSCACPEGLVSVGTKCLPAGCDDARDANRCPVNTLNPCMQDSGGRCLSAATPREDALSRCQEMRSSAKHLNETAAAAVAEKNDKCGKGEFIWCCVELGKNAQELQLEQGASNFAEFQTWGPQVTRITANAVSRVTGRLTEIDEATAAELKKLTGALHSLSVSFELAVSLCASGNLQACSNAGRGGIRGFATKARTYGRSLLAYTRRVNKIVDYAQYGTSNALVLKLLKFGTMAQKMVTAAWNFVLRNKWKLLFVVLLSSTTLTLASGMLATASLQMGSNTLVAQAFLRHVVSHIVCPLMASPIVQGFMLKWLVQNVLFNPVVVNAIDTGLAGLGPIRGLMGWWLKQGGATMSLKDYADDMKAKFGKISVVVYMIMAALGNTIFNAIVALVCGTASVLTDVVSSTEKVGSEAAGVISRTWTRGFTSTWNFLNQKLGGEGAKAAASQIGDLQSQLVALQDSAGAVPLQEILIQGAKNLMTFEKFSRYMEPVLLTLAGATGVLQKLGAWIGGIVPGVLHTMGLDVGRLADPNADANEDGVDAAIKDSEACISSITKPKANHDAAEKQKSAQLEESAFDGLCGILAQTEQTLRKLTDPLPRDKTCPLRSNDLLGAVRPNEIQMPPFQQVEVDITPLW